MLEEVNFERIKSISLFAIPYFTVCGGLYQITYWDTFGLNGLEYMDLSTLIKSFIYPFLTFSLVYIAFNVIFSYIGNEMGLVPHGGGRLKSEKTLEIKIKGVRIFDFNNFIHSKIVISIFVIFWAFIVISAYIKHDWVLWSGIAPLVPFLIIDNSGFLRDKFSTNITRVRVITCLIYILTFSFAAGKYKSELIYNNVKYSYLLKSSNLNINVPIGDTLKLIGIINQRVYATNIKNDKIFMIKLDKIDTLITMNYNRYKK